MNKLILIKSTVEKPGHFRNNHNIWDLLLFILRLSFEPKEFTHQCNLKSNIPLSFSWQNLSSFPISDELYITYSILKPYLRSIQRNQLWNCHSFQRKLTPDIPIYESINWNSSLWKTHHQIQHKVNDKCLLVKIEKLTFIID